MKSARPRQWLPAASSHTSGLVARAFTLIEMMVVVAIFGLVLTMGVPSIYKVFHKESLRSAVADVVEACNKARAQAILRGADYDMRLSPRAPGLGLGGASAVNRAHFADAPPGSPAAANERVTVEMLDVNFIEYKDAPEARVRFYPNGTCDELTIVLRSDQNEYRKISLECTTGLVMVESIR
jgi:prepilin-type N-terminal cleavage/methylation domain-containing protein